MKGYEEELKKINDLIVETQRVQNFTKRVQENLERRILKSEKVYALTAELYLCGFWQLRRKLKITNRLKELVFNG